MAEEYDYHFLFLAPDLPAAWFLQAARQYWLRFQPIVISDTRLVASAPSGSSVAVTVLTRSPQTGVLTDQLHAARPDGLTVDLVYAADLPSAEVALNARAASGLPLGERGE